MGGRDRLVRRIRERSVLPLRVRRSIRSAPVPAQVEDALVEAAAEAVRNADRHAGVDEAELTVRSHRGTTVVEVVDRGVGLPDALQPGFGVASSIMERMHAVGGLGELLPRPDGGTVVRLTWPAPGGRPERFSIADCYERTVDVSGTRVFGRMAVPVLLANVYLAGRYAPQGRAPLLCLLVAAALLLAVVGLVVQLSRRPSGPLSVGCVAVAMPALMATGLAAAGPGALADLRSWCVGFAATGLTLQAYVVPGRVLPVLVVPSLVVVAVSAALDATVGGPAVIGAFVAAGALQLATWAVAAQVRRTEQALAVQRDRLIGAIAEGRRHEYVERARRVHLDHTSSQILPWLRAVAEGRLDCTAPGVREQARLLGLEARDDLYLPGFYDEALRRAVRAFRERGGRVDVRPGFPPGAGRRLVGRLLLAVVDGLDGRHRVTLTPPASPGHPGRLVVVPPLPAGHLRVLASVQQWGSVREAADDVSTTLEFPIPFAAVLSAVPRSGGSGDRRPGGILREEAR